VEIGPNQLASAHITQYAPARTRPFAEVHDLVKARLVASRAAEMAKKEGLDKMAAWKANGAAAAVEAAVVVSRDKTENVPPQVVEAVLRANAATLPAWTGVDLGPQGYVVARINKLVPRAPTDETAAKLERSRYERAWSLAESEAYYTLLKDRFKAQIKVAEPPKAAAGADGDVPLAAQ